MRIVPFVAGLLALSGGLSPASAEPPGKHPGGPRSFEVLEVHATAYNSVSEQTDDTPDIAAWGDRLRPGMKVIAVSRDLLDKGLDRGARVRIEGIDGDFVVLDKMHWRWDRRIDIYMGEDIDAARRFGLRRVKIYWEGF